MCPLALHALCRAYAWIAKVSITILRLAPSCGLPRVAQLVSLPLATMRHGLCNPVSYPVLALPAHGFDQRPRKHRQLRP